MHLFAWDHIGSRAYSRIEFCELGYQLDLLNIVTGRSIISFLVATVVIIQFLVCSCDTHLLIVTFFIFEICAPMDIRDI